MHLHCGLNETLNYSRLRFWIPSARPLIKKILKYCVTCRKVQSKPFQSVIEPPLPEERISKSMPFQITGIDYSGAITVREQSTSTKVYIALFTCMVTRAVHLEVAGSNSEEDFLRAFIKFASRRSFPSIVYSDNAMNFVSASKTLKDIANSQLVSSAFNNYQVEWRFITPRAPWQGGAWERMIGITKTSLKKILGKSLVTRQDLETILAQIEAKINDRPLTYLSEDINDLQPLTPSLLINGRRIKEFPDPVEIEDIRDPSFQEKAILTKCLTHNQLLLQNFWKRWHSDYLLSLRERSQSNNVALNNSIKIGDIVQIHGDSPRVNWKLGRVIAFITGSDNLVRSVELVTDSGKIIRPITKLYPLEVTANTIQPEATVSTGTSDPATRPRRLAAEKALALIKNSI
ncbi:uncharacterized protein LOC125177954 [Hyalella azteca]|uniref:Uncharacterized protein LOC125177954 n=1 Tax=Hyalella azteca TaxID=294128 RepID=A0A979FK98_HYAAZ|nr:uncharacterized protein LOC125177954 [Hyalella azteca]